MGDASLFEWSTVPSTNATIGGKSVAENCAAANLNDAIRSLMAASKGANVMWVTSGTDTYVITPAPALTAYPATGMVILAFFGNASTSATPTINLNGLGAKTIQGPTGGTLGTGALHGPHVLYWDASVFWLLNPATGTPAAGSIINSQLANAANLTLKSNISGAPAAPADNGLSAIIDAVLGSTEGQILQRGASSWQVLAAGASAGLVLTSGGPGALNSWSAPVVTQYFSSTGQTITQAGALTLAHGMSAAPKMLEMFLQCTTAEQGYSIGDITKAIGGLGDGAAITFDATNLYVRYYNSATVFQAIHKTSGSAVNLTNANWVAIFRASA